VSGRVLVVEDDGALSALYQRVLRADGFEVHAAATGKQALEQIARHQFDAIVSDIAMPEMDGVSLLQSLREVDELVPVLFLTGQPAVESVQRAIELRAFRYLLKPVGLSALVASVRRAASCCRWIRAREAAANAVRNSDVVELSEAELAVQLEDGLDLLRVYYQPVVDVQSRRLRGFRILGRSLHPALPTFEDLLVVADKLGRRAELRNKLWSLTTAPFEYLHESLLLFVWTDLDGLTDALEHRELNARAPQTVLMVSDRRGIEDGADERALLSKLRARGYRLGVDQLGEGYAGLNSLAWLEPEFLELEATLIRHLADDAEQQRLVGALGALAKELGAVVTAEGVADEWDARVLSQLGCNLFSWDVAATPDELAPFSAATASELRC